MDIKKLQYFMTVAEEGQITKAAKRLNMAQPPLSHQIKVFENELGVQLIEKAGRNIQITSVGQALLERGEQILNLVNKTEQEIKEIQRGLQGTLSIGSVASWGATFLPNRLKLFIEHYPEIVFQLWEGSSQRIIELLNTGVIEIGIVPASVGISSYDSIKLTDESLVAAINSTCSDIPPNDAICLTEIADKPLIIHRKRKNFFMEFFQQYNLQPKFVCLYDDVRSAVSLANAGLGVALVPKTTTFVIQGANLIYKEIKNPLIKVDVYVIWLKNRHLPIVAQRFLETFKK